MTSKTDFRITAALLIAYAILGIAAFSLLASVFDFPDILRKPIADRFALFQKRETVIIPAYYLFALTGILQIFISGYLFRVNNTNSSNGLLGLIFGVLAGLCQTFGFIRWVAAIPYLTTMGTTADVGTLEGVLNAYFGMSVGEHLGGLFLAIWLIYSFLSMRESQIFDRRLSYAALVCGVLMLPVAFEPLGSPFALFAFLSIPVYGLVITWFLLVAYSLLRYREGTVKISFAVWIIALVFWLANIVPAFV